MEFCASSSYYIARIGEYSGAISILAEIGFVLTAKPFGGLIFFIKLNPQNIKKIKKYENLLNRVTTTLKSSRALDQFLPDYELI